MRRGVVLAALCLLLTACSPSSPDPGTEELPLEEAPGVTVYTDWSKLEEREEPLPPVGTQWYDTYTDHLIPREDYGPLRPYAGLRLMDDWPAADGCLYGLMTRDGAAVTAPVYSNISRPGAADESGQWQPFPLMILKRGDPAASEEWDPAAYAVAAIDGSWCTPFDYCAVTSSREGLILFQRDGFTGMSPQGEIQRTWTVAEMRITQEVFDGMLSNIAWHEGLGGERQGDLLCLGWNPEDDTYTQLLCFDLSSGTAQVIPDDVWYDMQDTGAGVVEREPMDEDTRRIQDKWLGADAPGLLERMVRGEDGITYVYSLEDGTALPQFSREDSKWYQRVSVVDGFIEVLDRNTASYYDIETLECNFRTYLGFEGD